MYKEKSRNKLFFRHHHRHLDQWLFLPFRLYTSLHLHFSFRFSSAFVLMANRDHMFSLFFCLLSFISSLSWAFSPIPFAPHRMTHFRNLIFTFFRILYPIHLVFHVSCIHKCSTAQCQYQLHTHLCLCFFLYFRFLFLILGLRKVYPYYFTFTTFTKGRWVGEKILDVFAREFRAHPAEEYERCIKAGTLTVNYEKVPIDCRLKHNDLLANIVHR